jgi:hypothetical protein
MMFERRSIRVFFVQEANRGRFRTETDVELVAFAFIPQGIFGLLNHSVTKIGQMIGFNGELDS